MSTEQTIRRFSHLSEAELKQLISACCDRCNVLYQHLDHERAAEELNLCRALRRELQHELRILEVRANYKT